MTHQLTNAAGSPDHSPMNRGYMIIEATLQLSIQVNLDEDNLPRGEPELEITKAEALRLAPMLMPTVQEMMGEELPEELQDRLFDEMNRRARRALSKIPQGEYDALAEAIGNRISQENSVEDSAEN